MSEKQKQKVAVRCPNCNNERLMTLGSLQLRTYHHKPLTCGNCAADQRRGHKMSLVSRQKMRAAKVGTVAWNKGMKMTLLCEHCKELYHPKGTTRTQFCSRQCAQRYRVANGTHHLWKGGITDINFAVRSMTEYKTWKQQIIERDGFICQTCRVSSYKNHFVLMHVDHIKPLSLILGEHRITTVEDARACNELWDTENGRVLCAPCHKETDTWAGRINSIYEKTYAI